MSSGGQFFMSPDKWCTGTCDNLGTTAPELLWRSLSDGPHRSHHQYQLPLARTANHRAPLLCGSIR